MNMQAQFGKALQRIRKKKGLTQEDFSVVSSRTYLSSLERDLKSPTLEKIEQLAGVLGVHPISLIAMAYLEKKGADQAILFKNVSEEIARITN